MHIRQHHCCSTDGGWGSHVHPPVGTYSGACSGSRTAGSIGLVCCGRWPRRLHAPIASVEQWRRAVCVGGCEDCREQQDQTELPTMIPGHAGHPTPCVGRLSSIASVLVGPILQSLRQVSRRDSLDSGQVRDRASHAKRPMYTSRRHPATIDGISDESCRRRVERAR